MTNPKVAILIPTMNRSDFLIRQLRYYASVESPHPVYIGDSSNADHRKKVEMVIEELQDHITVYYFHCPELNDRQTTARLIEFAEEPYCSFIGDDDFLVPNSLTKCAQFLEQNPEYSTAQGKGILFSLNEVGPYGAMGSLGTYWSRNEVEENTGEQRLINFFPKNYFVNQFSVHRTDDFVQDSEFYKGIDDSSFGELLHCNLAIIRGKSKFIDSFYLIRQVHPEQHIGLYLNWKNDAFDWLTHLDWQPSFQVYQKTLTRSLSEVDGIGEDEAYEIVKQTLWSYLARTLWSYLARGVPRKYNLKYGHSSANSQSSTTNDQARNELFPLKGHKKVSHLTFLNLIDSIERNRGPLKEFLKRIPGTRQASALVRNVVNTRKIAMQTRKIAMQAERGDLSLPSLLHASSPYHSDFIPVYKTIVEKPEKENFFIENDS